jgi:hypothetical protein
MYTTQVCVSVYISKLYEPMEHWEVDENTNVDVFEETEENYPRSYEYVKA